MKIIVPSGPITPEEAKALQENVKASWHGEVSYFVTPYRFQVIDLNSGIDRKAKIVNVAIEDPTIPESYLEEVYREIQEKKYLDGYFYALQVPACVEVVHAGV